MVVYGCIFLNNRTSFYRFILFTFRCCLHLWLYIIEELVALGVNLAI